ncbi:MAG: glycosyltransferase family 4 protein [Marinosulfonomonas sp.]|nr:glycosyltransferase family 4 protein [Marinosulfonomonas sp.]
MKILQISHNYHVTGGSDAVFFATTELLQNAGHQVVPFCMDSPHNLPTRWSGFFPRGADTKTRNVSDTLRYFYNLEARRKLEELLRVAGPFDVAHIHIYHGKMTPAILPALRRHRIPVLHSLHEYKLACPVYTMQRNEKPCDSCLTSGPLTSLRHRCKDGSLVRSAVMAAEFMTARMLGDVRLIDRFLCVSDFQRRVMVRATIPVAKLATLHNFVDTTALKFQGDDDGYLLYFGRIEKLKGLPTLLDAVAKTGHKLIIAGKGDWVQQLVARISHLSNVEYVGFKTGPELSHLVARARAVVVPSEWNENCPMSVLEAKARGKPVIGANIGGIPELIRDGIDGFLFTPGNANALAKSLNALDTGCATFGFKARQDIEARFSPKTYLGALLGQYKSLQEAQNKLSMQPA